MNNYENAMSYIEAQEATEISYVEVGDNNKKLIVSFGSNAHTGFDRKTSLMELKYQRNDFDVLYLRNQYKWYLGGLSGSGKNITHTTAFLKKKFSKYDKVLCTGFSAGGYAGLLFGSILNVNKVNVIDAQTDLQYCTTNLSDTDQGKQNLIKRSKQCPATWIKYSKIANVLNVNVSYDVFYRGDDNLKKGIRDVFLHGNYHYDLIKEFPTVNKRCHTKSVITLINQFLEE